MKKTILISGGSGLLATNLACCFRDEFQVLLLLHERMIHLDGCRTVKLETYDRRHLSDVIEKYKPDLWINAAAITNVEFCEEYADKARSINVDLAALLAKCCFQADVPFVQISTDHLFDGVHGFASEASDCTPLNVYAQTKADAEAAVLEEHPSALVLRTSFFGWGPQYRSSFSDWIIDALRERQVVTLFHDVYITPVSTNYLAGCLIKLFQAKATGIYNVSSNERITKYELGLLLSEVFELDPSPLKSVSISDKLDLERRPHDMSLSNSKLVKLLGDVPSLRSQCQDLKAFEFFSPKYLVGNSVMPYAKQFVDCADISAVSSVLRGSFLTQGPCVAEFEKRFAMAVNSKFAVAVSSGTAALHLACVALDLSLGDLVITTPLSFVATANAILYAGAEPIFADVDRRTLNLNVDAVREILEKTPRVKAISVVHFAGAPGPMQALRNLADEYGVKIIEDASHALGASYADGQMVGSGVFGDLATFSLHPVKGVTAGEGGVITTNDEQTYHKLMKLRSHGINKGNFQFLGISYPSDDFLDPESAFEDGELRPWYYEMQQLGFNYRLTDFQSALGISQLGKLNSYIDQRRRLVAFYDKAFLPANHISPTQVSLRSQSAHHIYVAEIDFAAIGISRHQFMKKMMAAGIGSQVHYIPIVAQPFYRQRGFDLDDYPNTRDYFDKALTLPLYYQMTPWQQDQVVDVVGGLLRATS